MMEQELLKSGSRIGRWTLLTQGKTKGHTTWKCICDCGLTRDVYACHLKAGKSKGCKDCGTKTHGKSNTRAWASWMAMRDRCSNINHPHFRNYGGKGIEVCERWKSFENFYIDMGDRPEGMSLDRIDNDKGYSPENCRWATPKEQSNNLSNNRFIEFNGEFFTMAALAEKLCLNYQTLRSRVKYGSKLDRPLRGRNG